MALDASATGLTLDFFDAPASGAPLDFFDVPTFLRRRLRTERTILIAEQLLVFWLESEVVEGVLIEPAIAGGQEMITNLLNDTNGVCHRLEDTTLALRVPFCAGLSLTCETGASPVLVGKRSR